VPSISPDVIVVAAARVPHPGELTARVSARFPSSPIVVIDVPARDHRLRSALEADAFAVLPEPAALGEWLAQLPGALRPSLGALPRFSARVVEIIEYVSVHFATVTFHDLGRVLGKSPYYLSRLFRSETGMSLKTYLNRARIEAARQLLVETNDKTETIAALVGLHDASHLSRLFLKYVGRRPRDWRRAWQERQPDAAD
jgi:AraC-like DNA-binding protein